MLMKEARTCWGWLGCVKVGGWLCGWIGLGWVGFHTKRIYDHFESSEVPASSCPCAGKTESEDDKEVESTSGEFVTTTVPQFYCLLGDDGRMGTWSYNMVDRRRKEGEEGPAVFLIWMYFCLNFRRYQVTSSLSTSPVSTEGSL